MRPSRWFRTRRSLPAPMRSPGERLSAARGVRTIGGMATWQPESLRKLDRGILLGCLLSDNLDQHPLLAPAVELSIIDLFHGAEVEAAPRHRHDHIAAEDAALVLGIEVVIDDRVLWKRACSSL